jgi:hypothetical protein
MGNGRWVADGIRLELDGMVTPSLKPLLGYCIVIDCQLNMKFSRRAFDLLAGIAHRIKSYTLPYC